MNSSAKPTGASGVGAACPVCQFEKVAADQRLCRKCVGPDNEMLRCPRCHNPIESNQLETCDVCRLERPTGGWPAPPLDFEGIALLTELGRSSSSVAYLASDKERQNETLFVVKIGTRYLDRQRTFASFQNEVRLAAQLEEVSDVVVRARRARRSRDDVPFLRAELAGAPTLGRVLDERGVPLKPSHTVRVALKLVSALDPVHDRGWVHLGLKPSNVFVLPRAQGDERVRLATSRFAYRLPPEKGDLAQVHIKNYRKSLPILGSPEFMAPEQVRQFDRSTEDAPELTPAADIYALGRLMYHMLTLMPPFDPPPRSVEQWIQAQRQGDPIPVGRRKKDVPPRLADVVARCLTRDPWERYQTVAELKGALEDVLAAEKERLAHKRAMKARKRTRMRQLDAEQQRAMRDPGKVGRSSIPRPNPSRRRTTGAIPLAGQSGKVSLPPPAAVGSKSRPVAGSRKWIVAGVLVLLAAVVVALGITAAGPSSSRGTWAGGTIPPDQGVDYGDDDEFDMLGSRRPRTRPRRKPGRRTADQPRGVATPVTTTVTYRFVFEPRGVKARVSVEENGIRTSCDPRACALYGLYKRTFIIEAPGYETIKRIIMPRGEPEETHRVRLYKRIAPVGRPVIRTVDKPPGQKPKPVAPKPKTDKVPAVKGPKTMDDDKL